MIWPRRRWSSWFELLLSFAVKASPDELWCESDAMLVKCIVRPESLQ